jgi:hypothetical protein
MIPRPRITRTALALIAAGALALLVAGCAFVKPGSLSLSQPSGIGAVRVHFILCSLGEGGGCSTKNEEESATVQYLVGIAVPPGSTPPQTFTATSTKGGAPIAFTRNEEVTPEITAASASLQKFISEGTQKEKEEAEALKPILGGPWPPPGLQGFGYLSATVEEVKGQNVEWTVDADFGLPPAAQGGNPFTGPFATGLAFGFRLAEGAQSPGRPVHCIRYSKSEPPKESDAFCSGSVGEAQLGTSELAIVPPSKQAQAFVGGSAEIAYSLKFGGTGSSVPSFTLSAASAAKGAKAKVSPGSFTPGTPNPGSHLSPAGTGKVTVTVPKSLKPGTYESTLTAKTAQGGSVSGVAKFKVVKAKIKFGKVKVNSAKGFATLPVKVPGAGKLTITGKGIKKTSKKSKKAQSLKMKIKPTGSVLAKLESAGSVKVKAKATFKPSSGISVSKTKSIVLKLK